ncbi:DEAD/DEAH box helicase [Paenibacillus yanchengensis]|uniref:DEAD/DEAH box helicase n=1 Tax=Paenibacillus yanchengensis TaxID=2035833 RepID=A0ABW4YK93_9BACL
MSTNQFNQLGLSPAICTSLQQDGIVRPTPIQQQAIPHAMNNKDIIAMAQTGTGKTLAFALPILQKIDPNKQQTQALILTPTRELAIQITTEIKKYALPLQITILSAYGGQDVDAQIRKLKHNPNIIVATPGRLLDHMQRETINLGKLETLVLDEADQMLHMGFLTDVETIIHRTPRSRQTMLFSATMPDKIKQLAQQYMQTPIDIRIKAEKVTLKNIKQVIVETTDRSKQRTLIQLLEMYTPYLAVIFCRTKVRAKKLNEALQEHGFEADELHGDLSQAKREQVMKKFRDAKLQLLVATDVAARGIDVEGITHVFNYDTPPDGEHYIHRIGRTGRAGSEGIAITLATPYDKQTIFTIERSIGEAIKRQPAPAARHTDEEELPDKKQRSIKPNRNKKSNSRTNKANSSNPWQEKKTTAAPAKTRTNKRTSSQPSRTAGKQRDAKQQPGKQRDARQQPKNVASRRGANRNALRFK